jgi:integrase
MAIYALKHPNTGFLTQRDTLLMCLLLDHGLRVGEVAVLKKTDINLTNKLLTFDRPKVSKDAELHLLTDDTYAAAAAYVPTISDEQESLFDLAVSSIQERVRMLGQAVGIPNLSLHDCRHSYADRAARSGATLDALMQAGGRSNYQTPLGYLKRRAISNDGITL